MQFLFFFFLTTVSSLFCEEELFQSKEIIPHASKVIELCHMIYQEAPYHYRGDDVEYESYLKSYSQAKDAVTVLSFDQGRAIGLGIGIPMLETRELYKKPLLQAGYPLNDLFYIGEFGLQREYRNKGIEEEMLKKIETFAKQHEYKTLCLWEIEDTSTSIPKDDFWKRMGFVLHPELNFLIYWKDSGNTYETPHLAVYRIKELAKAH